MAKREQGFGSRTREWADILIPVLREVSRRHGYALAVHGSLNYDIDLLAAPWTDNVAGNPTDAETLAAAFAEVIKAVTGLDWANINKGPESKPHGRQAWSFHLGGGPYIDLSVMPRIRFTLA